MVYELLPWIWTVGALYELHSWYMNCCHCIWTVGLLYELLAWYKNFWHVLWTVFMVYELLSWNMNCWHIFCYFKWYGCFLDIFRLDSYLCLVFQVHAYWYICSHIFLPSNKIVKNVRIGFCRAFRMNMVIAKPWSNLNPRSQLLSFLKLLWLLSAKWSQIRSDFTRYRKAGCYLYLICWI